MYTLIANSEVANSILLLCECCYRAFPQAKGMIKCIQFMESRLNESDVRLSNLSKTVDYLVIYVVIGSRKLNTCANQVVGQKQRALPTTQTLILKLNYESAQMKRK